MSTFKKNIRGLPFLIVLAGLIQTASWGQSGASYELEWDSVDGGSGQSEGGSYQMNHTAGQPDTTLLQSGQYHLQSGFWGIVAQGETETPTPSATPTATQTATATPTASSTPPIATNTPTSTATISPSTETPTSTPIDTFSPTVSPTSTCSADYDLNGQGGIEHQDLLLLIEYLKNDDSQGDLNCDGAMDKYDLLLFSRKWQEMEGAGN